MEQVINVEPRTPNKKSGARKLRAQGKIPGILYGAKESAVPFAVDPAQVERTLKSSGFGKNTLITLKGLDREAICLLKDAQLDPVKHKLLHLDLIEVNAKDDLVLDIPIEITGKAKGVVMGGMVQQARRVFKVRAKPNAIPTKITLDVTELELGDGIRAGEVKLPAGVVSALPESLTLVAVNAPRGSKEDEAAEAAAAEKAAAAAAAAPAAGAAAATPAAGDKKPAAGDKKPAEKKG
jgi:large subunit ribosomal protein L25